MKKTLLATSVATVVAFGGAAYAGPDDLPQALVSGNVSLEFDETLDDNIGASTHTELQIETGLAYGRVDMQITGEDDFVLDEWEVGALFNSTTVSFGDQNDVWVGPDEATSIVIPQMDESLQVSVAGFEAALGFDNYAADIADLNNVQAAYTYTPMFGTFVKGAVDYNLDTDAAIFGAEVGHTLGITGLGVAATYADSDIAYRAHAGMYDVTAYFGGDEADLLQDVGLEYEREVSNGVVLSADVNYNLNTDELTPSAGIKVMF